MTVFLRGTFMWTDFNFAAFYQFRSILSMPRYAFLCTALLDPGSLLAVEHFQQGAMIRGDYSRGMPEYGEGRGGGGRYLTSCSVQ